MLVILIKKCLYIVSRLETTGHTVGLDSATTTRKNQQGQRLCTDKTTESMNQDQAVEGLKGLGLTTYEARVFIALQKLGHGAASEISEVADVPRSQVYGAADGLEERGLVETQQSTPTVYRPVPLEQARKHLLDQLAETGAEAFEYLETVQNTHEHEERSESIWLVNSADAIKSRTAELIDDAEDRILYAADRQSLCDEETLAALEAAAQDGVAVMFASVNRSVLESLPDDSAIQRYKIPEERDMDVNTGRLLIVDGQTLLLSTYSDTEENTEVAFWTSENIFAAVIIELAEEWLQNPFE